MQCSRMSSITHCASPLNCRKRRQSGTSAASRAAHAMVTILCTSQCTTAREPYVRPWIKIGRMSASRNGRTLSFIHDYPNENRMLVRNPRIVTFQRTPLRSVRIRFDVGELV
jgi:hypothetical protein